MGREDKTKAFPAAVELQKPAGFINTPGGRITIGELVGKKVVLVDFWTYSCINCQRTLPYLNAWYEKYRDKGLEIIGVHTPEFEFESKRENVEAAVKKFGIKYPVVMDNEYATWSAYRNRYWPRKYLIDIDGFIVFDHIGEGAYEETERRIQQLLEERMEKLGEPAGIRSNLAQPTGVEQPQAGSPETYFGAARNEFLANGEPGKEGEQALELPASGLRPNALYLGGKWRFTQEFAENAEAGARIAFLYGAKNVFLVASAEEDPVEVLVVVDGKPVGEHAGEDVNLNENSVVRIGEPRLYKLVRDTAFGGHTLELVVLKPGLRAFAFTFG